MQRVTQEQLLDMKKRAEKITVLTAYDASMTFQLEKAGVDVILVGDSLGMVVQGHDTTQAVTMDDMVYHTRNVARKREKALLVTDMPYHSYTNEAEALSNARHLCEAGADMVKMEGADEVIEYTRVICQAGIPVCGHLGLLPQSVTKPDQFRVQGRDTTAAEKMLDDAKLLQQAGAGMIVLECIPQKLARRISEAVSIPTIGIGAGVDCDGQVLVTYDLLGLTPGKRPRFSKDYVLEQTQGRGIGDALAEFVRDVKEGRFPDEQHSFN